MKRTQNSEITTGLIEKNGYKRRVVRPKAWKEEAIEDVTVTNVQ